MIDNSRERVWSTIPNCTINPKPHPLPRVCTFVSPSYMSSYMCTCSSMCLSQFLEYSAISRASLGGTHPRWRGVGSWCSPPVSDPGRELVSVSRLVEPRQTPAVVVALRGVTSLKHTHHYTHGRTRSSIAQNDLQRRKRHDICQGWAMSALSRKRRLILWPEV